VFVKVDGVMDLVVNGCGLNGDNSREAGDVNRRLGLVVRCLRTGANEGLHARVCACSGVLHCSCSNARHGQTRAETAPATTSSC
jgi:hypothetical protein